LKILSWIWIKLKGFMALLFILSISPFLLVTLAPFFIFEWVDYHLDKRPETYKEDFL
jgi:hypothetical protein